MKSVIGISARGEQLRDFIEGVARDGMPRNVREIYRARNVVAVASMPAGEVNIKQFRRPGFINSRIYTLLRQSKARRSFDYASQLKALGFGTPEPLAYIENREGSRLLDSYYISQQISASELRFVENRADEKELLEALGREMVRLHRAGVLMLDFSPGNIMFEPDGKGGYEFFYVDLNRTRFNVADRSKLMEMFRAIAYEPRQIEIVARAYAREGGLDEGTTVSDALRRHARFQNHLKRKQKLKRRLMPWRKKYRS